jgi:hypothetical protein
MPRFSSQLPEPGHLWIRHAPRAWEGPERPWLDLGAGRLGRNAKPAGTRPPSASPAPRVPEVAPSESSPGVAAPGGLGLLDDVVYLPPVSRRGAPERDELAERALAAGLPVLVQLLPGDETAIPFAGGAVFVVDLLAVLLEGDLARLDAVPSWAAVAVWPLIAGVTDERTLWERGCQRLAAAGLRRVQAVTPALAPGDRRRLAEGLSDNAYEALFHRQPAEERDFARVAYRHGLAPFLPRPLPRAPLPRAENRRVAGQLAVSGDLWLRLGRPVEAAQALFRAARWLDATHYDVDALAREGNLAVITAFDPLARQAVVDAVDLGETPLLAELLDEYLQPAPPAAPGSLEAAGASGASVSVHPEPPQDALAVAGEPIGGERTDDDDELG